jgi:RNA polymerase sigma factor (sigma-70 family)
MEAGMDGLDLTRALAPSVAAAAAGDREAFGRLVDATGSLVCSIALAILRDVEASRDVAQDVFLAAWRDLRKLRNPASFLPWLRQMTRNRAHHELRSKIRRRRIVPDMSDQEADDLLAAVVDARPDASDHLLATEERRLLAAAIGELPDEAREVVTLFYREGRSVRQVADLLGMREDAVKQRLSRARSRLRQAMLERLGETLQRTAPGAAFTAGVVALTFAAPGSAAAAGLGLSGKLASSGLLVKLLAVVGGAGLGATGGVAGVFLGARPLFARARDDEERRDLRRFVAVSVAATLAAAAGFVASSGPRGVIATFSLFYLTLIALHFIWLPRIIARRLAAELRENPEAARRRHRRDHWLSLLGAVLGLLAGGSGVVWAVLQMSPP